MNKEYVKVRLNDIIHFERNARKNSNAVDPVAKSMQRTGYLSPIVVDENNVILAGHTRALALKKMGEKEIEVLRVDGLTESQKQEYRIRDNKTGEIAEWDFEILEADFSSDELIDFGFDENKIIGHLSDEEIKEVEKSFKNETLRPFKTVRILLSMEQNLFFEIQDKLKDIKNIHGIEYDQCQN